MTFQIFFVDPTKKWSETNPNSIWFIKIDSKFLQQQPKKKRSIEWMNGHDICVNTIQSIIESMVLTFFFGWNQYVPNNNAKKNLKEFHIFNDFPFKFWLSKLSIKYWWRWWWWKSIWFGFPQIETNWCPKKNKILRPDIYRE